MIEKVVIDGKTYYEIDDWDIHLLLTASEYKNAKKRYIKWQDQLYQRYG